MTEVYPYGPRKDARLTQNSQSSGQHYCANGNRSAQSLNDGCGHARASDDRRPSQWAFCTVVPRTDVKGRHFGKDHPEYQAVLEHNRRTGEYRTRPLTEVLENNNE